jgi:cytidylate kinase
VGRCADYALAGRPGLLRIFCRADLTQRIKRIRQRHNLSPEKAALLVAKTDRHRRVYYHHHTGKFWGHSSCYDLTVNTSVLGVEKTAEALEAYIRAFQEQD